MATVQRAVLLVWLWVLITTPNQVIL